MQELYYLLRLWLVIMHAHMHASMQATYTRQQPQLKYSSSNPHFVAPGMQIWDPPVRCIIQYLVSVFAGLSVVLNLQNNVLS
jgi:hypothetical protein